MGLNFHARYALEHKILPGIFYDEGPRLLRKFMLDGGKVMREYYGKIAQATPSYKCPYAQKHLSDEEFFPDHVKAHIDRGIILLEQEARYGDDLLIHLTELEKGI